MDQQPSALVTGASTGIGYELSKVLIQKGYLVFGSVRTVADANRLSKDFGQNFVPLQFDVTDYAAIEKSVDLVKAKLGKNKLSLLINNAGVAVFGPLAHLGMEDFKKQFEINVFGPQKITQVYLPLLGMDQTLVGLPGKIINISSVAGKRGLPFLGPYAASKHALEGWSQSLRRELLPFGIDVIVIGPGTIKTPIWDKAEDQGMQQFDNTTYKQSLKQFGDFAISAGKTGLEVSAIGDLLIKILQTKKPQTRYAIVPNPIYNQVLPAILPPRVLDRLIAKKFGL